MDTYILWLVGCLYQVENFELHFGIMVKSEAVWEKSVLTVILTKNTS